jgi:uncharacterized protein YjbI with pentapeptide repeats
MRLAAVWVITTLAFAGALSPVRVATLFQGSAVVSMTPEASAFQPTPTPSPTPTSPPKADSADNGLKEQLERQKLGEEIRKLRSDNDRANSLLGQLITVAPFLTAVVAILTIGAAAWRQQTENSRQRTADRGERQRESRRRFDEQFAVAVSNLASADEACQTAGASSLLRFASWDSVEAAGEIQLFLSALLRLDGVAKRVQPIVLEALVSSIRTAFVRVGDKSQPPSRLNLDSVDLSNADLSCLNLRHTRISLRGSKLVATILRDSQFWKASARGVDLSNAKAGRVNFGQADLRDATCVNTDLSGARLASAKLLNANLTRARLVGAEMQSAHFEHANLSGANFRHADINDAYFTGATIDATCLESMTEAKNWMKAHYDPAVREALLRSDRSGTGYAP